MTGISKKLFSSLLALVMVFGLFAAMPPTARAANEYTVTLNNSIIHFSNAEHLLATHKSFSISSVVENATPVLAYDWTASTSAGGIVNHIPISGTEANSIDLEPLLAGYTTITVTVYDNQAAPTKTGTANILVIVDEAAPSIGIDYVNEMLTGFAMTSAYQIAHAGGMTISVSNPNPGTIPIDSVLFGKTGMIYKMIVYSGFNVDISAMQSLPIPARPAAPTPGKTDATAGNNDGTITGVNTTMEYSSDNGATWTPCAGTSITGLAPGTYLVRVAANNGASRFKSNNTSVTIATNAPGSSSSGIRWYPPDPVSSTSTTPVTPKSPFPAGGEAAKRINVYKYEKLKTTLFRLNKGDAFDALGLANGGKALLIEQDGRQGYIALKDIGVMFGAPIRAIALKKAAAYILQANGKLKRTGYFTKDQELSIDGIWGKYLINKRTDRTYYLDAAQWVLAE